MGETMQPQTQTRATIVNWILEKHVLTFQLYFSPKVRIPLFIHFWMYCYRLSLSPEGVI